MPKKPCSPFIFFQTEETERIKKTEGLAHAAAFKKAAANWKSCSEKDRKKYEKKAEADKHRYEAERKQIEDRGYFLLPDGKKSTEVKVDAQGHKLKEKFPDYEGVEPKKPLSAYFCFSMAKVPQLRAERSLKITEATKAVSKLWAEMSDIEKAPYVKLAEDDHKRYAKQVADIVDRGFFIF